MHLHIGPMPVLSTPITPKENFKLLLAGKKPLWLPSFREVQHAAPIFLPDNRARATKKVDVTPFTGEFGGKDMFGVNWVFMPEANGSMVMPGTHPVPDICQWEKYISFPDLDAWDWEGCSRLNNRFSNPDQFTSFWVVSGLFERVISFIGFEEALMALLMEDESEAMMRLFDALAEFYDRYFERIAYWFDVDALYFHDDWGSQRAPFFSPETCMNMIVPYMKKITDAAHRHGLLFDFHSCGKNETLVPCMRAAGVDCWLGQPINDPALSYENAKGRPAIGVELGLTADMSDEEAFRRIDAILEQFPDGGVYTGPFMGSQAAWEYMYRRSRALYCGE